MAEKVRWGVLGSGGIARRRTIPEGIMPAHNAELAAVYDLDERVNAEVAKEHGVQAALSLDSLLGKELEAIYIATPNYLHCEQVITCAEAGKHMLCEKPLGMTVVEAEKMIAVSREAGVILGTAFMMRFLAQHQAALALIREGQLGRPVYGRAQLSCWYPCLEDAWRQDPGKSGGGSLMDMGGHCIDLMEMFFGEIEKVGCCINSTVHEYKSEDSAVATLFFRNGALATVDTFYCIPDGASRNFLEIYGTKGCILASGTIGQAESGKMTAYLEEEDAVYDPRQERQQARGRAISPEPVNTYRAEIEEFSRAILERREPGNNAGLGLRNQKILAACYQSARSSEMVEIQ